MSGEAWAESVATICPQPKPLSQPVAILPCKGRGPRRIAAWWWGVRVRECPQALTPLHHRLRRRSPSPAGGGMAGRRAPRRPQKQNGSRRCRRPPLVPGPNCRAGEGLASFLGGSNAIGASSSGVRGSGRGLATSVGSLRMIARRTCRSSVCGSFGRSLRFRMISRRKWDRLAPHASSSIDRSIAPVACDPKIADRGPRWPRLGAFLPCGRSAPHRGG